MKLLIVVSTLDLKYRLGCTPAWWQLFKALYEMGNDLIVVPYLGDAIETPWWRTYPNPCARESTVFNSLLSRKPGKSFTEPGLFSRLSKVLISKYIRPKWRRHLLHILSEEGNVDAILFMNVPINHITGIPSKIKQVSNIPIIYYDGDMPTILPGDAEMRGFKFSYYVDADLAEYDAFITNSKGVIPTLEKIGARNVQVLYYGVTPDLYTPVQIEQDIDIFYYGHGSQNREDRMGFMITEPSRQLPNVKFMVAGRDFNLDLGLAKVTGVLPIATWRTYCCRSKINLNITRETHAQVYASSTSRVFELASLGCCIVSDPYDGLEEWFEIGKEVFMVHNAEEAVETYRRLLSSEELRHKTGELARQRVMKEHTYEHRARQLMSIIGGVTGEK